MSKPLEEHMVDYLLGLADTPERKRYAKACLAQWREIYGEAFISRVKSLLAKKAKR